MGLVAASLMKTSPKPQKAIQVKGKSRVSRSGGVQAGSELPVSRLEPTQG